MSDTPIDERTFTDREVREILKRAVQRAPSANAVSKREGMSLADLKSIAEEVGIEPARLEDAARAVASDGGNQGSGILGTPMTLHFERRVQGQLGPDDTPELLSVIRRATGVQGEAQDIHGSLEWNSKTEPLTRYVTVSSKDGSTTVRSSANLKSLAGLMYGMPAMFGTILSIITFVAGADEGNAAQMIVAFLILPVLFTVIRTIMSNVGKKESAKMERVADEIARLAEGKAE